MTGRAEPPGKDINDLLQQEPLRLRANIKGALQELKRLNTGRDPADFLFSSPGLVLSIEEQIHN